MKFSRRRFCENYRSAALGATAIPAFGAEKSNNEKSPVQQNNNSADVSRRIFVGQRDGFVSGRRRGQGRRAQTDDLGYFFAYAGENG